MKRFFLFCLFPVMIACSNDGDTLFLEQHDGRVWGEVTCCIEQYYRFNDSPDLVVEQWFNIAEPNDDGCFFYGPYTLNAESIEILEHTATLLSLREDSGSEQWVTTYSISDEGTLSILYEEYSNGQVINADYEFYEPMFSKDVDALAVCTN